MDTEDVIVGGHEMQNRSMNDEAGESYRFKYSVFTVDTRFVNGLLVAKTGIRTSVTPIDKLQYLYLDAPRHREHVELILAFSGRKGQLKRVRIFADQGETQFDLLIKALLERRPDTDIRHLPVEDAYARMGSKQMEKIVIPALLGLALTAAVLLFMPLILHGLDQGELRTTPTALAAMDAFESRNIILERGKLLPSKAVTEASLSEARVGLISAWIPIVGENWEEKDPVQVILFLRHVSPEKLNEVSASKNHQGILRNIWWEGLDEQRRQELVGRDLVVASSPLMLEWGKKGSEDGLIALILLGILLLILLGLGYGLLKNAEHIRKSRIQVKQVNPWRRQ